MPSSRNSSCQIRAALRPRRREKYKSMVDIMKVARYAVLQTADENTIEAEKYNHLVCEKCRLGDGDEKLLLCDNCDQGYHMDCLQPIILSIPEGSWYCKNCSSQSSFQDHNIVARRPKRRACGKKPRRILAYTPTENGQCRIKQMTTLRDALTSQNLGYCDELIYSNGKAPRSANRSQLHENHQVQKLAKEDWETIEKCKNMSRNGEFPPLKVVPHEFEGLTVVADENIKYMTFLGEYCGDVDFHSNCQFDESNDSVMLLYGKNPCESLVICPYQRGNITRFISGINNHKSGAKKKQNVKFVTYSVAEECRIFLVAFRDITKGDILYLDYNGDRNDYPTKHFH